jgi:stage II sporulation protein M
MTNEFINHFHIPFLSEELVNNKSITENRMKPVLSISLAVLTTFLLILGIISLLIDLVPFSSVKLPILTIIFLGGVMATWFSTGNKIRYSAYYGIIFLILGIFLFSLSFSTILIPICAVIGGIIAKNEKDTIKNLILNKEFDGTIQGFFVDLYNRNKLFLMISLAIFFVSVLIGAIGPFFSDSFNQFMTKLMINYFSVVHNHKFTTLAVFLNNSNLAFFYIYLGGISGGIITTIEIAIVGALYNGFILVKYPRIIIYILPHGIFEISAYIIAAAAGYKLLFTIISVITDLLYLKRNTSIIEHFNRILNLNYLKFRDSLTLFGIAVALLVVAAIIEVNISHTLANYIYSL